MTISHTIHVVAAIIERSGTVFAARRNEHRTAGGLWEFPGGKVESGETPEAALQRELKEELAIEATVGRFIDQSRTVLRAQAIEMSCYAVSLLGRDPERSTDHDAMMWIGLDKLTSLDWAPADIPIIERLPVTLGKHGTAPISPVNPAAREVGARNASL